MKSVFNGKIKYILKKENKDRTEINKTKIFNEDFVKNNEPNFIIIYNNQKLNLTSFLEISSDKKSFEINLLQTNKITNVSKMFSGCTDLDSFQSLSELDTENVTDISDIFANTNIKMIPNISKWNTSNIINMSGIFKGCKFLFSIPDISKWDTSKVTNFSSMFWGCSNLEELPDLSKWNTSKVKTMKEMFSGCSSLKELPDISNWDISQVSNMQMMFYGCTGLNSLPDLNKWNINNLKSYLFMFQFCNTHLNFPAFYKRQEDNKSKIYPRSETLNNIDINKINIFKDLKVQENIYSKNYLSCPKCNLIPKIIFENNEIVLLFCDFCGYSEKVKISEIIDIKSNSKWIKKVYFKCSCHKGLNKPYANKYCINCELFLCGKCLNTHNEGHKLEFIPNLDIIFCEKHSSKINKFCETCNENICKICTQIEHKSHNIKEINNKDKFNLENLENYCNKLEDKKLEKIHILEKIETNLGENMTDNKFELLQLFRKDLKEIEDFKKLGKILYYSSKKVGPKDNKDEIINNYLDTLDYICSLFDEDNMKYFRELVQTKIDECQIIDVDLSDKEKEILKKIINDNFSIVSSKSDFIKKKKYIENNIDCSRILKKHIIIEKNKNPDNFIDIDENLNNLNKVIDGINSDSSDFILSVIGKCAYNNGTEVFISKNSSEEFKNLELSSLQSLFSFGTQKKYELHFNLGEKENEMILNSPDKQEEFIKKYKKIISTELKLKENDFIFKDIHRGSLGASMAIVDSSQELENSIENLQGNNNIENIEEKPLLESLLISPDILDPKWNRFDGWGLNEIRGKEKYIPPTDNWRGYGLKVKGMYDKGDNSWLGFKNQKGEFAIAYMGINNFIGESKKIIPLINDSLPDNKKNQTINLFNKDFNSRNSGFKYKKCGNGVCLFQDPKYAENVAGIVNANGYTIKVILMCRVNPEKIRQPENFKECWILNPTPDEIRPYRILIKIIPNSPLTDTKFITYETKPVDYILEIFKSKDFSFYEHKKEYIEELAFLEKNDKNIKDKITSKNFWNKVKSYPNDKFAITFYTANYFYRNINDYLRDRLNLVKNPEEVKMPIDLIRSFIFCLQESLRNNKGVKDGTIVYRGIRGVKFSTDIKKGSQIYLRDFNSTSLNEKVAKKFAGKEGTLLIITIKNNKERNYCFSIKDFSRYSYEGEVLISSFCKYIVTEIIRDEKGNDIVKLDCEGFQEDFMKK